MRVHHKKEFINWLENNLSNSKQNQVSQHLNKCRGCRYYFEAMSKFMEKPPIPVWQQLETQPFEKTRIIAAAETKKNEPAIRIKPFLRTIPLLYPILLVLAIIGGIWTGKGLVNPDQQTELYTFAMEQQEYLYISEYGFDNVWSDLSGENQNED